MDKENKVISLKHFRRAREVEEGFCPNYEYDDAKYTSSCMRRSKREAVTPVRTGKKTIARRRSL